MELAEKLSYEAKIYSDPMLPQNKRMEALRRFDELLEKAYDVKFWSPDG